jgi:LAS superfamily LD-carboxypeptidase LdcB
MSQSKYDERTEANIATLQSDFAERVQLWLAEARKQGLNPLIHFGARSVEKQRELHDDFVNHRGPRAVAPERSYHCYGRAFDWVNITDPDGGEKGLAFDDDKAYAKGTKIAEQFDIRGIGESDNDHLQDTHFPTFADLPQAEFGRFPNAALV